jgi:LmbE family N-acetylglucosaminyl deacetylase
MKNVAVIVAHPDDETLWTGGTLLNHPEWKSFVACLCRKNDEDRAPRFYKVLSLLNAEGAMGDLEDGPDQFPVDDKVVQNAIVALLPPQHFDLVITHNPNGEYTRHLRHEEVSRASIQLWNTRQISAGELWTFAYEDGGRKYPAKPVPAADLYFPLDEETWRQKYYLMNIEYNFNKESWEAQTTPRAESFWRFTEPDKALTWVEQGGKP